MSWAAIIALSTALVVAVSTLTYFAVQALRARNATSTEREAHSATRLDLERERLQHDIAKQRLAQTDRTIAALHEALDDAEAIASDLDPSDVVSRVRRAAAKANRDSAIRDSAGSEVPGASAPSGTGSALMPLED